MTDLSRNIEKMQTEEVDKKSPLSERFFQKVGSNVNALLSRIKFDVGDMQYSILSEANFQSVHDTTWVLCDGQNIEGTDLGDLTGLAFVPDCRAMFTRQLNEETTGIDANRALNTFQDSIVKAHAHDQLATDGSGLLLNDEAIDFPSIRIHRFSSSSNEPDAGATNTDGTSESRPFNIAFNIFIKINE